MEGGLGIRLAADMNRALLARLGWRLLNKRDSLRSQTLASKYGQGTEGFNILEHKIGSSHIWKCLVQSAKLKRAKWMINNGRTVSFWGNLWAEEVPLSSVARGTVPAEHIKKKVHEYWRAGGGWEWSLFESLLPMISTLLNTVAIFMADRDEKSNVLKWGGGPNEKFIVSRAHKKIREANHEILWAH